MYSELQIFNADMQSKGYRPFIPSCCTLGYSLDNGSTYLGYDDEADQPYFLADKVTGKKIVSSPIGQVLINNWTAYELLTQKFIHLIDCSFKHGDYLIEFVDQQFTVSICNEWVASFKRFDDCFAYVNTVGIRLA